MTKRLKLVQKGYENYSGPIGEYEFLDGVSVETIPGNVRDRLCAAFQCEEIDDEGNAQMSGSAHRLVADAAMRAAPENLLRQTEEEKEAELAQDVEKAKLLKKAALPLLSEDEIDAIIRKGGIKALREQAADAWGVRHRSIPVLRAMLIAAMDDYRKADAARLIRRAAEEPALEPEVKPIREEQESVESDSDPEFEEIDEGDPELSAAVTGNLAAALDTEKSE